MHFNLTRQLSPLDILLTFYCISLALSGAAQKLYCVSQKCRLSGYCVPKTMIINSGFLQVIENKIKRATLFETRCIYAQLALIRQTYCAEFPQVLENP